MICIKCKAEVADGKYCLNCGAAQTPRKRSRRARANGMGTAYKRGKTWTAVVVVGWDKSEDGERLLPEKRTKGGFTTKRDALAHCQTLRANHTPKKETTIKALHDAYLVTGYTKLSASKQTAYKIAYDKIKDIHNAPIQSLTIASLQGLVTEKKYYPARDIKSLMSHIYKIACAQGDATVNLARFMVLPELEEAEPEPFNNDELKAFWAAYSAGDTWIGYILLMIYSGMMPGELLKCRKDMIDLSNQKIVGCGMKTKKRKADPIVLADFIVPVVESLMELNDTDKLISINRDNFYAMYHEKIIQCGCRDLPPYSCRHTTATALAIGENISPALIQRIMRHAKFTTTQRYIHPSVGESVAAINKLDPVLDK